MKLKSYRELFEKLDTSSKFDEKMLAMGREAEKGNTDFGEAADFKATELPPQRKKTLKGSLSRSFAAAAINVAACALVLLIVWIPLKMADVAKTGASTASTAFEESVVSTGMTYSDESSAASDTTHSVESTEAAIPTEINYFSGILAEGIEMYAFTPDFSYSDGHITVRAEQMISDGLKAYLIVSYECLDELGKHWLKEYFAKLDSFDASVLLSISPVFPNESTISGVVWSSECTMAEDAGLKQYETSTKKYFMLSYSTNSDRCGIESVTLEYPLPGTIKSTTIAVSEFLPRNVYQIEAVLEEDNYYLPAMVTITPLSIHIEGKDLGIEQISTEIADVEQKREVDSVMLVFRDDTSWDLYTPDATYGHTRYCSFKRFWASRYSEEQIYDDIDCQIFTGFFSEPIDMEQVKGIWINDVYYDLK